jgi:hypothetical protein
MKNAVWISLLALGLSSTGCFNRAHMSEHYGRAYRQAFERQVVNPAGVGSSRFPKGLDALEAGIVVETYRTQLAPKGVNTSNEMPMIVLSPQAASGGGAYSPAPSVPGGR